LGSFLSYITPLALDELTGPKVTLIAYPGTGKTAIAKEPVSVITSPANMH
jgi:hypothetical protein